MNSQGPTPPGWYTDPNGDRRWWNGDGWTEATEPPPAPESPPGHARRRRGVPVLVAMVGAVVVVAALVVGLLMVLGGDDEDPGPVAQETSGPTGPTGTTGPTEPIEPSEPSEPTAVTTDDPVDVVHRFVGATRRGDCRAIEVLVTAELLEREGSCRPADLAGLDRMRLTTGEPQVRGRRATVPLTVRGPGTQTTTVDLRLVLRDHRWLINGME